MPKIYWNFTSEKVLTLDWIEGFSIREKDTLIVKGLLNIIQYILNNETKEEIMKLNIEDILNNVGLGNSITSQRTNGLINALNKIKKEIN